MSTKLASGDLSGLVLPRDLEVLRSEVTNLLEQGSPLDPLYQALATEAPVALVDLVLGPKAATGTQAVQAALKVLPALVEQTTPAGTIRRLGDLAPESKSQVLAAAVQAFPSAGWLVGLSDKFEDQVPGSAHLNGTQAHPAYPGLCVAHAKAGHIAALMDQAALGHAAAVGALSLVDSQAATQAAGLLLAEHPQVRVVPWIAAAKGISAQEILLPLMSRLRSRGAAMNLLADLGPFPLAQARLSLILAGLRA
ncbi:MAG: hypothetical protein ACI9VR_004934 [Cognaticolwellia sp.]|jgi:hypothetical protein